MCLLTNERYKTYQTGFSFGRLGHAPGVGLGGTVGVGGKKNFFPKFNQIWCVSYLQNQIKSNQINFIGIKSSHRTVTSHMYTVTQEQSQT